MKRIILAALISLFAANVYAYQFPAYVECVSVNNTHESCIPADMPNVAIYNFNDGKRAHGTKAVAVCRNGICNYGALDYQGVTEEGYLPPNYVDESIKGTYIVPYGYYLSTAEDGRAIAYDFNTGPEFGGARAPALKAAVVANNKVEACSDTKMKAYRAEVGPDAMITMDQLGEWNKQCGGKGE